MSSKFFLFSFLLIAISFSVSAQKVLKGIVVDSISLNGIPNVNVKFKDTNRGTITDANGMFTLRVKETDTLILSSVGYVRVELPVLLDDEVMFIRMVQEVVLLKEVEVHGRPGAYGKDLPSLKLRSKSMAFNGAMPNSGGAGASVNLAYFSKQEREKRKLNKLKAVLASTQTYVDIVTNPEVIQEIEERFSLNDSTFYKVLTHFNEQHQDMVHSSNSGDILNSLFYFFENEVRYRRIRH